VKSVGKRSEAVKGQELAYYTNLTSKNRKKATKSKPNRWRGKKLTLTKADAFN
jgi:hypothetical protein